MTDTVAAWIKAHWLVDLVLQDAAIGIGLVITLGCLCGIVYLALFLRRLTRKENRRSFTQQSIPSVTGGKLWGAEVTIGAVLEASEETVEGLRGLEERVATLEESVERVETQVGRMEDVSGRLLPNPEGANG